MSLPPFTMSKYISELDLHKDAHAYYKAENATLHARIAELETGAEEYRQLLESGEFVRDAQYKLIAELTEWRPMETAPKDGLFLAWDAFYDAFHICQTTPYGKVYSTMGGDDVCFTGWLPLPQPKGE